MQCNIKKHTATIATALVACLAMLANASPQGEAISHVGVSQGSSDTQAEGVAHIFAEVSPNISITAPISSGQTGGGTASGVDFITNKYLGSIQTGYINASIDFEVHSNNQDIYLACAATHLYKGNIPDPNGFHDDDDADDPITLDDAYGCRINMPLGNPIGGASNIAQFNQGSSSIPGTQGYAWVFNHTHPIHFETNVSEPTQTVTLNLRWYQSDPAKKQGIYSGFVKLVGWVQDPGGEACIDGACL